MSARQSIPCMRTGALLAVAALWLSGCEPARRPIVQDDRESAEQPKWQGIIRNGRPVSDDEDLPEPIILTYQRITPAEAETENAITPIDAASLSSAAPFSLSSSLTNDERQAAIDCLTADVYYEAGGYSEDTQRAVAQVVINRVRHAAFPKTVCGVIFQGADHPTGCQFAFTCSGLLSRKPRRELWARTRSIAEAALTGHVEASVGLSTHYHARTLLPYARSDLMKAAVVGPLIFYRWQTNYAPVQRPGVVEREALPNKLATAAAGLVHLPTGSTPYSTAPMLQADGQLTPLVP